MRVSPGKFQADASASGRLGGPRDRDTRRQDGPDGTYLFELIAHPGGPEGRSDTIASSWLIREIERPRDGLALELAICKNPVIKEPRVDGHLVPNPVSLGEQTNNRLSTRPANPQPLGYIVHTRYDDAGNVTGVKDIYGKLTQYVYDANGRQTVTIDTLGNRTTTLYDDAGQVTGTLDQYNKLTQYEYDAAGRQTVTIDTQGNRATTLFDTAGNVTGVQDVRGNLTKYLYDSFGRETVVVDVFNKRSTTLYNSDGQVTGTLDQLGNLTEFGYDALGRQNTTTDAGSNTTTTLYDSHGNVTGVEDPRGNITGYDFDAYGRQDATIDADGKRTTSLFDSHGNVTGSEDALTHITAYGYDSYGRQNTTTDAGGNTTTTLYDSHGNVSGVQDPRGKLTAYDFDGYGRQDATIDALGKRTTSLFDSHGNVTGVEDPRGNITGYHFDSFGRQDAAIDPLGNRTTSIYDGYGQVTIAEDPLGNETNYVFDAAGRATVTVTPDNLRATTFYDAAGNVTGIKDTAGNLTQYQVDALGRTTVTIDANNYRTTQLFDALGNLTYLKDAANNISTFAYDALNRETVATDANNHTATFAYNAVGLMTSMTDRLGRRRDFSYDALNRLTTQIWYNSGGSATETMTYSYDANSNLLTASNSAGTYTMSYDALNRVTVAQDVWGHTLTMSYDAVGNRTVVQDSKGGTTTSTYDAANQLSRREFNDGTTALHLDLTYTDAGQTESIRRYYGTQSPFPMAALTSFSYDAEGRIDNLHHTNGTGGNIANLTYTFDNAGNLETEVLDGATTSYVHDSTDQLTADGTSTFTYDGTGNRTNTGYSTGTGNQLTGDGTWTFSYDAEGNMTKKTKGTSAETWTYGYDNRDQMIWAEDRSTDGGTLISRADYKYDVFGNRVEKQLDTDGDGNVDTTEKFAYDGWKGAMSPVVGQGFTDNSNWDVWADLDSSGSLTTRYLRGDAVDQLFARVGSGAVTLWELTDRLGSVRDVIDNTGAVKDAIAYDGWGNIISESGSSWRGRYTWTGREYDTETQLQYNRARYYDPALGRWTTQDPLGFDAGDSSLYRYALNNAVHYSDPSGLAVTPSHIVVVGNNLRKPSYGFGFVPKLGPIYGKSDAAFGFYVGVHATMGKGDSVETGLTVEQRVWVLAWGKPRKGTPQAKLIGKNKYFDVLWDGKGKNQIINDKKADQEWNLWKKDKIWNHMFPDVTTDKKAVGAPPKNNTFDKWLLDPRYRFGPKKQQREKGIVQVHDLAKTGFIAYVDRIGTRNVRPDLFENYSLRFAVEIKATGNGKSVKARFWVWAKFTNDCTTWKLAKMKVKDKAKEDDALQVEPEEILTKKDGKLFF